jgi:CheY-like chemotaxis protein
MAASAIFLVDADVASDGPAALELSRHHPSGLAFLDYKIQDMDGAELCCPLKRVRADTVGLLVTAFAAATARAAGRAGIRQVLSRPVESGRLIALIGEVARTP